MSDNTYNGTYQGIVVRNNDPHAGARVTLRIPQILGSSESAWASPSSPTNTVPTAGTIVYVTFEGGDIAHPVYNSHGLTDIVGKIPKQPIGITLAGSLYASPEGVTLATVSVSWTAPGENQDGSVPIDLTGYYIEYSYDNTAWTGGVYSKDPSTIFNAMKTGTLTYFRVASVNHNNQLSVYGSGSITTPTGPSTPPPGSMIATAQNTANGKNTVTYATGGPGATPNSYGDIWWTRDATSGIITAQYEGQGGTSWAARTVGSDVIANLDAGKLTAYSIDVSKIALGVLSSNTLPDPGFENSNVVFGSQGLNSWHINTNTAGGTITRVQAGARSGQFALQITAPSNSGQVQIGSGIIPVVPGMQYRLTASSVAVLGSGTITATLVYGATKIGATNVQTLDASATNVALTPPSGVTNPPVSASYTSFGADVVIPVGAMWAGLVFTVVGTSLTMFMDDVSLILKGVGGATELTGAGLRLFNDSGSEIGSFVSNRPNTLSVSDGISTLASVDNLGRATFADLSIRNDPTFQGSRLTTLLNKAPRGIVTEKSWHPAGVAPIACTNEIGTGEMGFVVESNRLYRAYVVPPHVTATDALCGVFHTLRYAVGVTGSLSIANTGVYSKVETQISALGNWASSPPIAAFFSGNTGDRIRFLLTHRRAGGSGNPTIMIDTDRGIEMWIEDVGPYVAAGWDANTGDGTTPAPYQSFVSTWTSTGSASYKEDGTARAGGDGGKVYLGYSSATQGNQSGAWFFEGGATTGEAGRTVAACLAGAIIDKVEAYITFENWYYGAGDAPIFLHQSPTLSTTKPTPWTGYWTYTNWPAGASYWVDITQNFTTATRGFGIGPQPNNYQGLYGYATGGTGAQMRITYRR